MILWRRQAFSLNPVSPTPLILVHVYCQFRGAFSVKKAVEQPHSRHLLGNCFLPSSPSSRCETYPSLVDLSPPKATFLDFVGLPTAGFVAVAQGAFCFFPHFFDLVPPGSGSPFPFPNRTPLRPPRFCPVWPLTNFYGHNYNPFSRPAQKAACLVRWSDDAARSSLPRVPPPYANTLLCSLRDPPEMPPFSRSFCFYF